MRKALLGIIALFICLVGVLASLRAVHASIPSKEVDFGAPVNRGNLVALMNMKGKTQTLHLDARGMNLAANERLHIYRATAQWNSKTGELDFSGFEKIAVCTNSFSCLGEVKMEWSDVFLLMYRVETVEPPSLNKDKK